MKSVTQRTETPKGDRLLFWRSAGAAARAEGGFQAQGAGDSCLPGCRPEGLLSIYTGAEGDEFMHKEGLIDPVPPVARRLDRQGVSQVRELEAGPGPVHGVVDEPGADRIPEHVAEECKEMAVLLYEKTLEAALPHMPMTSIMAVIPSHMTGHPPLHQWTDRVGGRGRHDEVKMIRHQAEAEDLERMADFGLSKQLKEGSIVSGLVKDGGSTIATVQDVVRVSGSLSPRNARHRTCTIREYAGGTQGKVACPLSSCNGTLLVTGSMSACAMFPARVVLRNHLPTMPVMSSSRTGYAPDISAKRKWLG